MLKLDEYVSLREHYRRNLNDIQRAQDLRTIHEAHKTHGSSFHLNRSAFSMIVLFLVIVLTSFVTEAQPIPNTDGVPASEEWFIGEQTHLNRQIMSAVNTFTEVDLPDSNHPEPQPICYDWRLSDVHPATKWVQRIPPHDLASLASSGCLKDKDGHIMIITAGILNVIELKKYLY